MPRRDLLRRIPLFADLDDRACDALLGRARERSVGKGAVICHQNESGGGLHCIVAGSVKITRTGREGRDVTLAVLREGNFFGEMSLLDGQPRSAAATALQATRLLVIDRADALRLLPPAASVGGRLLRELSLRLRAADQAIEHLALGSVRGRILHLFGHLGRRAPLRDGAGVIDRAPTHQEIAEMVGASRETVTRTLAALQAEGLVAISRRRVTLPAAFFLTERQRP